MAQPRFYTVTTQKRFDILIAVFIIANVVTMSAESFMSSEQHAQILAVFDFVFNFVFGAEVVAKMAGLYPAGYFSSNWNRFDFIVVMVPPPPHPALDPLLCFCEAPQGCVAPPLLYAAPEGCVRTGVRDAACPISTGGGTRRFQLVREGGGGEQE